MSTSIVRRFARSSHQDAEDTTISAAFIHFDGYCSMRALASVVDRQALKRIPAFIGKLQQNQTGSHLLLTQDQDADVFKAYYNRKESIFSLGRNFYSTWKQNSWFLHKSIAWCSILSSYAFSWTASDVLGWERSFGGDLRMFFFFFFCSPHNI
jgi:hypothetical protein